MKYIQRLLKHPLFAGSFLMVGGSMAVNILNYLYQILMGKVMTQSDYGILSSLFAVLYIMIIAPLSTSAAIVKFISSSDTKDHAVIYSAVNKFIFKLAIVLSVIFLITTPFIAQFLHVNDLVSVALIAPIIFFSLVTLVNQASSQGVLNFFAVVGPNFMSAVGKLVFSLIFVLLGWSVAGAMGGVFMGVFLAYFLSVAMLNKSFKKKVNKKYDLKPFLKYSFPVLLQSFAFTSFFTADIVLVKHFMSAHDAGLYAAISTLGKIIYFAAQPITAVMFPIVSKRKSIGEKYHHVFLMSLAMTSLVASSISILYKLFPTLIIGISYKKDYIVTHGELFWMGMFMTFYTISYLLVNFLLSLGKTKIVIFPVLAAFLQIFLIINFHTDLLQVIQVSLVTMLILFLSVGSSLGYLKLRK